MILCAAVQIEILDSKGIKTVTIPCRRHSDGFEVIQIMREINSDPVRVIRIIRQGFITNRGEFTDRVEALKHAKECGQLSESTLWYKEDHCDIGLFSEDLY